MKNPIHTKNSFKTDDVAELKKRVTEKLERLINNKHKTG